jgi:hypothetical protein
MLNGIAFCYFSFGSEILYGLYWRERFQSRFPCSSCEDGFGYL